MFATFFRRIGGLICSICFIGCNMTTQPGISSLEVPLEVGCHPAENARVGEPIRILIDVTNLNPAGTKGGDIGFEVQDFYISMHEAGVRVPLTKTGEGKLQYATLLNYDGASLTGPIEVDHLVNVRPLSSVQFSVDIQPLFRVTRAGEYTVVVKRRFYCPSAIVLGAATKVVVAASDTGLVPDK